MPVRRTGAPCRVAIALALALLDGCAPSPRAPSAGSPAVASLDRVTSQQILSPLSLRVRLPIAMGAERVFVSYRLFGEPYWLTRELSRAGQTWSSSVSCRDVSTVTGDTLYFLYVIDSDGRIIATDGSTREPLVTHIVQALPGGRRGLDGESIVPCVDPADCPPDFPGCPRYALRREPCASDAECGAAGRCEWDGFCDRSD